MSKKQNQSADVNDPDALGPSFGQRHKDLIWFVIIIFVLAGPLVFAALTVISMLNK